MWFTKFVFENVKIFIKLLVELKFLCLKIDEIWNDFCEIDKIAYENLTKILQNVSSCPEKNRFCPSEHQFLLKIMLFWLIFPFSPFIRVETPKKR